MPLASSRKANKGRSRDQDQRYCCDGPDHVVFGRIVESVGNIGLERPLSAWNFRGCSVGSLGENVESNADMRSGL